MSLILDALKKSERERQRDKAPGLQSIHQPLPRREPRSRKQWWALAGLIALNAGVLVYWRMQPSVNVNTPATPAVESSMPQSAATTNPANTTAAEFTKISPAQLSAAQPQAQNNLRIEEVGELPDDVRNNLPAMTFSFHVYSSNTQQRTIIINNRRIREGDEISAGLQLQEITEDGVVLLNAGHRIHISVLSGW
jgi:general secretion pathway protein B